MLMVVQSSSHVSASKPPLHVCDTELRYVSSSKRCLGHPPLLTTFMLCTKQGKTGLGGACFRSKKDDFLSRVLQY